MNFIRCHYNPGWDRQKFLDSSISWENCFWVEPLFGDTAYLRDKVSVWIRNIFLGNAFSCNLDDKEWLIRRSRKQKNKNLFSIIKLSSNSSKSASSSPLSAAFSLEQFSKSNCRQKRYNRRDIICREVFSWVWKR